MKIYISVKFLWGEFGKLFSRAQKNGSETEINVT